MSNSFARIDLSQSIWEVPHRYQSLTAVGAGSYGQVCSALDTSRRLKVAIKRLTRAFQSAVHAKRTFRELRLLKHINHENVIGLLDVFTSSASADNMRDVYLVTHLMDTDLNAIIKSQPLSDDHVQCLVYQLLCGLKYIHSAGIIHRDLKPSNIAVNENCDLRILDFGLARPTEAQMTGYVSTRWYRAPEIMVNWMRYDLKVDIWSVGCVMAELITARPLFPGANHIDQLSRIMSFCGTPDDELMGKITSEDARNYIRTLPVMRKRNFNDAFRGANPNAIDLLEKMLELDADKRPTAEEALSHPYLITQYSDATNEHIAAHYDESFEDKDLSINQWRCLIYDQIINYSPVV